MNPLKPLLSFVFIVGMLAVFSGCQETQEMESDTQDSLLTQNSLQEYEISAEKVLQKTSNNENVVLIDVRTPEEYAEAHLENSTLIPVDTLATELATNNGMNKDDEIIVYCRSGRRSANAYEIMTALGYTNVKSMAGGINEWNSFGNKICSGVHNTC
jgi:rhodanese-related sulfurtransferase